VLSRNSLANLLMSIATGDLGRAADLISTSEELDATSRALLIEAVAVGPDRSADARSLGDALRSLGAARHLVNECYRVAFYSGREWQALTANPLFAFHSANKGGSALDKWVHYFAIYRDHLEKYRGLPVRVLEIGVQRGGGLELVHHFLGLQARLVGIDIDEAALVASQPRYDVEIGDQADPEFLRRVSEKHGPFDIVIDDGGHTMRQQIVSVETLFPLLAESATYMVEDCHTSYWPEYADQGPGGQTFINWAKDRMDDLNAYHFSTQKDLSAPWQTDLAAIHA
jgi:cephalosporin hydroxylase